MFYSFKGNLGPEGTVTNPAAESEVPVEQAVSDQAVSPAATSFITRNVIVAVLMAYAKYLLKTGKVDGKDDAAAEVGKIASAAMDAGHLTAEGLECILARVKECRVESSAEEIRSITERTRSELIDITVRCCAYDKAILDTLADDEKVVVSAAIDAWNAYMDTQWKLFDRFGSAIDEAFKTVLGNYKNLFDEGFVSIICKF